MTVTVYVGGPFNIHKFGLHLFLVKVPGSRKIYVEHTWLGFPTSMSRMYKIVSDIIRDIPDRD